MTVKGGTSQACAACKYQRRRCTPDCALAPYFPADKPKMFQNAHRLFGVCNIMKILKQLRDDQKEEAMKSIIYEADMRERFPVYGCSWVMLQLKEQLQQLQEELYYINSLLVTFRNNNKEHCQGQGQGQVPFSDPQFQLGYNNMPSHNNMNVMSGNSNSYYVSNSSPNQYQLMNGEMGYISNNNNQMLVGGEKNGMNNVGYVVESSDNNSGICGNNKALWMQQNNNIGNYYGNNMNGNGNVNSFGMKQQFGNNVIGTQQGMMPHEHDLDQHEIDVSHDYDDMPFDTIVDDRQSYVEYKEACDSSAESSMKDSIISQNHELKSAAACFTLTSVN